MTKPTTSLTEKTVAKHKRRRLVLHENDEEEEEYNDEHQRPSRKRRATVSNQPSNAEELQELIDSVDWPKGQIGKVHVDGLYLAKLMEAPVWRVDTIDEGIDAWKQKWSDLSNTKPTHKMTQKEFLALLEYCWLYGSIDPFDPAPAANHLHTSKINVNRIFKGFMELDSAIRTVYPRTFGDVCEIDLS